MTNFFEKGVSDYSKANVNVSSTVEASGSEIFSGISAVRGESYIISNGDD